MKVEVSTELVGAVARALFEAAEHVPGARVPVIAAEELARAALTAIADVGFVLHPPSANDNPKAAE